MPLHRLARIGRAQSVVLGVAAWLTFTAYPVLAEPAGDNRQIGKAANNEGKTPPASPVLSELIEPEVQTHRIDERGAEVAELRVRGQAQRIVVTPHNTDLPAYEIITGDGSRDLSYGASSTRGAAGQRVWHVLSF